MMETSTRLPARESAASRDSSAARSTAPRAVTGISSRLPGGKRPPHRTDGSRIAAGLPGANHRGTGLGAQRRRRIPVEIDPCHVDPCTLYLTRSLLFAFGIVLKAGRWAARAAALGASR